MEIQRDKSKKVHDYIVIKLDYCEEREMKIDDWIRKLQELLKRTTLGSRSTKNY